MKKKILISIISIMAIIGGIAALSAFEAHVINVTAHIENALSVNSKHLDFGTVFPQEYLEREFTISLSDSFLEQNRLNQVDYIIAQKPKCKIWSAQDPTVCEVYYENLCPFLSKLNTEKDEDEGNYENDTDALSYYQEGGVGMCTPPDKPCCITPQEAFGTLAKSENDTEDRWVVDLKVPPVEGYVGQDWPEDCPVIDTEADFGCDLWVEVKDISQKDSTLHGFWHFDEGQGNIAYDSSQYGNQGTIYGASWTSGKVGQALSFDGINDYVNVANNSSLQITSALTLEVWIKTPSSWNKEYPTPVSKAQLSGDWDGEYWIAINRGDHSPSLRNKFSFAFAPAGGSAIDHWSNSSLSANTWYHIVATFDDSANKVKLYLNGVLDKEYIETQKPAITNYPVRIGHGGYTNNYFNGIIDEVRIYNRVLSPAEILDHYNAGK